MNGTATTTSVASPTRPGGSPTRRPNIPSDFLSALPGPVRAALISSGHRITLEAGQPFFLQGDPAWTIGIVTHGYLKLCTVGTTGRTELVRLFGPGDMTGHVAAFVDQPRFGTATALVRSELLVVEFTEFERLLGEHPEMYPPLVQSLCCWLGHAVMAQCDHGTENVPTRLVRLLVNLSRPCGGGDTDELVVPLTQEELAQAIGASRESVARVLTKLRSDGIVATSRKQVTIEQPDMLRALADPRSGRSVVDRHA